MPDDIRPSDDDRGLPSRRWGAGILSALAVGLVVFGIVVLGEQGSSTNGSEAAPAAAATADGGTQAVDFDLTLFDGTHFDLESHLAEDGRPVFLNLWASWCPPCRAEMPHIDQAAVRHPDVLFLGIAVSDTADAAAAAALEIDVGYPLGFDNTGVIEAHYPSLGLPATFLISGDGEIIGTHIGQMRPDTIEQLIAELDA